MPSKCKVHIISFERVLRVRELVDNCLSGLDAPGLVHVAIFIAGLHHLNYGLLEYGRDFVSIFLRGLTIGKIQNRLPVLVRIVLVIFRDLPDEVSDWVHYIRGLSGLVLQLTPALSLPRS